MDREVSPFLWIESDKETYFHGQKTNFACHQFDHICGFVATVFDAWVDVTGAMNGWTQSRVGRSHRRRQLAALLAWPTNADCRCREVNTLNWPKSLRH